MNIRYFFILPCVLSLLIVSINKIDAKAADNPITIGVFIPTDTQAGEEALRGAEIAVALTNKENGIHGRPLKLAVGASNLLWEASVSELVRLIYKEAAVAVIGALNGRSAHLAEQVITRSRGQAIFITPWASEETLTQIRIPWFFRMVPDDLQQSDVIAREIFSNRKINRVAAWVDDTFDGQAAYRSFIRSAPPKTVTAFMADKKRDMARLMEQIKIKKFGAIALFASPHRAAELTIKLKKKSNEILLIGPMRLANTDFLDRTGGYAEKMLIVSPDYSKEGSHVKMFKRKFEKFYSRPPLALAYYCYDAIMIIAEALRNMNTMTGNLSDVLFKTTIQGITGKIRFNGHRGRDIYPAIAAVKGRRLVLSGKKE